MYFSPRLGTGVFLSCWCSINAAWNLGFLFCTLGFSPNFFRGRLRPFHLDEYFFCIILVTSCAYVVGRLMIHEDRHLPIALLQRPGTLDLFVFFRVLIIFFPCHVACNAIGRSVGIGIFL